MEKVSKVLGCANMPFALGQLFGDIMLRFNDKSPILYWVVN